MNRLFALILLTIPIANASAQAVDLRRKITVTGTAETQITPDIIYIGISLKEYFNGSKKAVEIDQLEKQLQEAVIKARIPKENLTVSNLSGWNDTWQKKKNPGFAVSKQYRLKVSDPAAFNLVMAALDPKSVENTTIDSYDHSRMAEYKKDLRLKALQAARQKAGDLSVVVNDTVGDALDIMEINNDEPPVRPMYANTVAMFHASRQAEGEPANIDFKTIRLTSQVRVVFELN
jgi:uncharacterized protein YggE